jgi:uroporphyrinogen-III decarboxylase
MNMGIKDICFILSSGCDLSPETPAENLDAFIEAALSHKG